jgi:guanylate kinase
MSKVIITLVGSTCSGKTTLKDQLLATGKYIEVISHTTRPMRTGEVDGETYHYVTHNEFDQMEMLERITYNGNVYGGSVQEFEKGFDSGLIPVIIVEPNGNEQINMNAREKDWVVVNVWVGCPVELQAERLVTRLCEDHSNIQFLSDGSYHKLIKEYSSRLVMIQTVENEWPALFAKSTLHDSTGSTSAAVVVNIPEFTADRESNERGRVEAVAELYRDQR